MWAARSACYTLSSKKLSLQAQLCTLAPAMSYIERLWHRYRQIVHTFNFNKKFRKIHKIARHWEKSSINYNIRPLKRNDHRSNVKFTVRLHQYFTMENRVSSREIASVYSHSTPIHYWIPTRVRKPNHTKRKGYSSAAVMLRSVADSKTIAVNSVTITHWLLVHIRHSVMQCLWACLFKPFKRIFPPSKHW